MEQGEVSLNYVSHIANQLEIPEDEFNPMDALDDVGWIPEDWIGIYLGKTSFYIDDPKDINLGAFDPKSLAKILDHIIINTPSDDIVNDFKHVIHTSHDEIELYIIASGDIEFMRTCFRFGFRFNNKSLDNLANVQQAYYKLIEPPMAKKINNLEPVHVHIVI